MDRDGAFNANWTVMDIPSEQTRNFKDLQPASAQSSTNCQLHLDLHPVTVYTSSFALAACAQLVYQKVDSIESCILYTSILHVTRNRMALCFTWQLKNLDLP